MTAKSYSATIEVINNPSEIFRCITHDVSRWWGGKDLSGHTLQQGDEFTVDHPGAHYSRQRLTEVTAGEKLIWTVTESRLSWLKNQEEWTGTRMIFEIKKKDYSSLLSFTHEGLLPEKESFIRCSQGWDMVIKDWLYNFILYGRPHF